MPSYDFEVDLESLINGAQKAAEVVQLKKDKDVEDYVPTEDALANDEVWEAVDEFQDRWERTINSMTDDIEEVAGRLSKVAANYAEYNTDAEEEMTAVMTAAEALAKTPLMEGS
ncbi:MAG: hypothetical protein Q4D79_08465 [Propionibacteriaceae bacterium]|nr:hypothetical protein [Propionibacteriaceae bacterium]